MGAVYRARHANLGRLVALKLLRPERTRDPQILARFRREMKAIGKLDHPNLVRATDAGEDHGVHYLAMDLVEGLDLGKVRRRLGRLSVADACAVARQAAAGLQHALEHGLVHRDVKPSNLMLTADGQVKLLDLGLALLRGETSECSDLTQSGQLMGTYDYMAPEQATESHAVDIRADLYSLGCTMYELLCGQPPSGGPQFGSAAKKILAHSHAPVPPIRRFCPEVPAALTAILDRLLAKNPIDRFATPAELSARLEPLTAGSDLPGLFARAQSGAALVCEKAGLQVSTPEIVVSHLESTDHECGVALAPPEPPPLAEPIVRPKTQTESSPRPLWLRWWSALLHVLAAIGMKLGLRPLWLRRAVALGLILAFAAVAWYLDRGRRRQPPPIPRENVQTLPEKVQTLPETVQVFFAEPKGMLVYVGAARNGPFDGEPAVCPKRLSLQPGRTHWLKLASIPTHSGVELYPSLEILPAPPDSVNDLYLKHSCIPVHFVGNDFERALSGELVIKSIEVPWPDEPGRVPPQDRADRPTNVEGHDEEQARAEAVRRRLLLAVVRMGNIDYRSAKPEEKPSKERPNGTPPPVAKAGESEHEQATSKERPNGTSTPGSVGTSGEKAVGKPTTGAAEPKGFSELAEQALKSDKLSDAAKLAEMALRHSPKGHEAARAHAVLADVYRRKGDVHNAMEHADAAVKAHANCALGYLARSRISFDQGDIAESLDDANEAIRLAPKGAEAYLHRGRIHAKRNQHEQAIADFSEAIRLSPDSAEAHLERGAAHAVSGQYDQAIADYTQVIRLEPERSPAYFARAQAYEKQGMDDQALADYSEAIRLDPKYAHAYLNRGLVYRRKGDTSRAAADLAEAKKLGLKVNGQDATQRTDSASAWAKERNDWAAEMLGSGELNDAEQLALQALQKMPNAIETARAYTIRAEISRRKGDLPLALRHADAALKADPKCEFARRVRSGIYYELGDMTKSIADADEAIQLDPTAPTTYFRRGLARLRVNDYGGAASDFTAVIRLRSDHYQSYLNRAFVHYKRQQYDQAIADLTEAIRRQPKTATAYNHRGWVQFSRGLDDQAIADYSEAIRLDPKNALAYRNRALACKRKGEAERAADDAAKARELGLSMSVAGSKGPRQSSAAGTSSGSAWDDPFSAEQLAAETGL